jgi:hypothetical protein
MEIGSMARYIDLSDAAKGKVQRAQARHYDFVAAFADIQARADAVKASGADDRKIARRLASLRTEYRSIQRYQYFADTGINVMHVGLED